MLIPIWMHTMKMILGENTIMVRQQEELVN